jgi:hypothetical protein
MSFYLLVCTLSYQPFHQLLHSMIEACRCELCHLFLFQGFLESDRQGPERVRTASRKFHVMLLTGSGEPREFVVAMLSHEAKRSSCRLDGDPSSSAIES